MVYNTTTWFASTALLESVSTLLDQYQSVVNLLVRSNEDRADHHNVM